MFILFFLPFIGFSQVDLTKDNERVFRSVSYVPYQNLNIGQIVVNKSIYGLTFENQNLTKETKKTVKRFFKQSLNGYSDLKMYHLKIERRANNIYIDNIKINH
ncbi:conserved hypothetical protein [Tenacibaculum maritimum]|nr:conserved hypothetical protein [Tenacibaculum maritimum]